MRVSIYPDIALDQAAARLGREAVRRGTEYVREGRVLQCQWSPDAATLVGTVRGNHFGVYTTTAVLVRRAADTWVVGGGLCSCPMRTDCKHVAALIVAAAERSNPGPRPSDWQHWLQVLLPPSAPDPAAPSISLGIELDLIAGPGPARLEALLVRPGKRGGWVSGDVNWSMLYRLAHSGYQRQQVETLRLLHALSQASNSAGYQHHAYGYGSFAIEKTLDLAALNPTQLWPLLADARGAGVALVEAGTEQEVRLESVGHLSLDVTADAAEATGSLSVRPVLEVDGRRVAAAAFLGSPAHGVAFDDGGLRLAPLDAPAAAGLQRLFGSGDVLTVPADSADQFALEFYPRLRSVAEVTSSDGSFTPPEITGPQAACGLPRRPPPGAHLVLVLSVGGQGRPYPGRVR